MAGSAPLSREGIIKVANEAYLSMTDRGSTGGNEGPTLAAMQWAFHGLCGLQEHEGADAVYETVGAMDEKARQLLLSQAVVELQRLGWKMPAGSPEEEA